MLKSSQLMVLQVILCQRNTLIAISLLESSKICLQATSLASKQQILLKKWIGKQNLPPIEITITT